jgi:hypothetical protein
LGIQRAALLSTGSTAKEKQLSIITHGIFQKLPLARSGASRRRAFAARVHTEVHAGVNFHVLETGAGDDMLDGVGFAEETKELHAGRADERGLLDGVGFKAVPAILQKKTGKDEVQVVGRIVEKDLLNGTLEAFLFHVHLDRLKLPRGELAPSLGQDIPCTLVGHHVQDVLIGRKPGRREGLQGNGPAKVQILERLIRDDQVASPLVRCPVPGSLSLASSIPHLRANQHDLPAAVKSFTRLVLCTVDEPLILQ